MDVAEPIVVSRLVRSLYLRNLARLRPREQRVPCATHTALPSVQPDHLGKDDVGDKADARPPRRLLCPPGLCSAVVQGQPRVDGAATTEDDDNEDVLAILRDKSVVKLLTFKAERGLMNISKGRRRRHDRGQRHVEYHRAGLTQRIDDRGALVG